MSKRNLLHPFKNQRGDTIVEVMIAVAVVSLVLVAAYASTNRNILNVQDAQEHSQALQLVQSQIEYLHQAGSLAAGYTCFDTDGPTNGPNCVVDSTGAPTTDEPAYHLSISTPCGTSAGSCSIAASWNNLRGGQDNVTMYYRPN